MTSEFSKCIAKIKKKVWFRDPYPDGWVEPLNKAIARQRIILGMSGVDMPASVDENSPASSAWLFTKYRQKNCSPQFSLPDINSITQLVADGEKFVAPLSVAKIDSRFELSAVEFVVEKAQETLTARRHNMKILASIAAVFFILILWKTNKALEGKSFLLSFYRHPDMSWQELVLVVLINGAMLGLFLASLYMLASLFRAFLHESTILDNRIHSIRLGRLYLYLKYLQADEEELQSIRSTLTSEDIQNAFGWNIETSTAFKDIDAKIVSQSVIGQVSAAIAAVFSRSRGGTGNA